MNVWRLIIDVLKESIWLFNEMAPYLIFGFLFAGILHIFISPGAVARHLGKNDFLSVVKASLFGIPLPLCSCGVLPAAASLRKEGASKGAVLSFLISTPTTGVDSILATYSLMGPVFAVYRIVASFFAGVFAGVLANIFLKHDAGQEGTGEKGKCKLCDEEEGHVHSFFERIKGVFDYAFGEMIADTGKWILAGVVIGGIIAYLIPDDFIQTYLGSGLKAMIVMLVIGMPMYVCATGSIPIAAALMLKGMNPGAAFVFLLSGPATNAVGMTVVAQSVGKKAFFIYLFSIIFSSIFLGFVLDWIWGYMNVPEIHTMLHERSMIPVWVKYVSSLFLIALIAYNSVKSVKSHPCH